jgi:hypothetical protein
VALTKLSMSLRLLSGRATRMMILYLPLIAVNPASFNIAILRFSQSMYCAERYNLLPLILHKRLTDGGRGSSISMTFPHPCVQINNQ